MRTVFLLVSSLFCVSGKIYERCELARELRTVHQAPMHQLATWVCIARHESEYKTDAVGHLGEKGTADHGIFQVNDRYWCSPVGKGRACLLSCDDLLDDDITDDFKCVQKIYKEHKGLSGDGFNAWAVYEPHCKGKKAAQYLKDCFLDGNATASPSGHGQKAHGLVNKEKDGTSVSPGRSPQVKDSQTTAIPAGTDSSTMKTVEDVRTTGTFQVSTTSTTGRTTLSNAVGSTVVSKQVVRSTNANPNGRKPVTLPSRGTDKKDTGHPSLRPLFIFNGVPWY